MSRIPTNVSFEEWVRCVFDHPVARDEWYWEIDTDAFELDPVRLVAYSTLVFEESAEALAPFTDEQVDQGFWFLIGATSELDVLGADVVPLTDRLRCIRSMFILFEQCFAGRCTPSLSHIDEQGAKPMNSICFMWWDLLWHLVTIHERLQASDLRHLIPIQARMQTSHRDEIDEACIAVMELTLELPSIACQESALHGLGHWGESRQERCHGVIASFLQRHQDVRPELREYALQAQEAKVW